MHKSVIKYFLISTVLSGSCYAKTFDAHSFTIKPINLNFYAYTFGHKRIMSKINDIEINTYRGYPGLAGNRTDKSGTGYDVEAGFMFTPAIEAFFLAGFTIDRPLYESTVKYAPFPFTNNNFRFKRRSTFNTSLGGRYYFDTESAWIPFVGLTVGAVFQGKTKAHVFDQNPGRVPINISIGHIEAQKSKTLIDGAFQAGVDYRLTDVWHLTMMTGLKYQPRAGKKISRVTDQQGRVRTITYQDNWNKWVVPFVVSLKIVL